MLGTESPGNSRSIGFPKSGALSPTGSAVNVSKPFKSPLALPPKPATRGKGRWFITLVIGSLLSFIFYSVWAEFGQYRAYGEIRGPIIQLSPIADGTLTDVLVKKGDLVVVGQLLARVDNFELQRERLRLRREVEVAQANLRVRLAEASVWERNTFSERVEKQVDYCRLLGEFHAGSSRLEELRTLFESNQKLRAVNAVSEAELVNSRANYEGQRALLQDLEPAIEVLKGSIKQLSRDDFSSIVSAEQARIESITRELREVEQLDRAAEIRAPYSGKILERVKHSGEFVQRSDIVFELLQCNSTEAVVYLSQTQGKLLNVGQEINLLVKTLGESRAFRVSQVAPQLVEPPAGIKRSYRAHSGLIQVHATPIDVDPQDQLSSWIGAEVALPRFGFLRTDSRPRTHAFSSRTLAEGN